MIENLIEKVKKDNKKVYIYAHKFPDGDAISSSCAIVEYLKNTGIDASYVVTNPITLYSEVFGEIPTTQVVASDSISLILDTSTLNYAENTLFLSSKTEDTYVIDHHIKPNGTTCIEDDLNIPQANIIRDSSASSTCEILLNELQREKISPQIANMLTLGLMTDTAKLKFLKPTTLQNLQTLLQLGADYNSILSVCNKKSHLRDEVGLAKILLKSQRINIGDTFGIILSVDNATVSALASQYGLRAIQKKIFKMADITDCSFNCISAENSPGEFDLEFRSTPIYGNFNVQKLAAMYGGGGHYNASGCHLSEKNGFTPQTVYSTITQYASDIYSNQAKNLEEIKLTDDDKSLASILDKTDRLTKGVTPSVLAEIDELVKKGANYNYTFKKFKSFERFMLENEILRRVPQSSLTQSNPIVNITLSQKDFNDLCQKYNLNETEILGTINAFSNINIESASVTLPNQKKAHIDKNGTVTIDDDSQSAKKSNTEISE